MKISKYRTRPEGKAFFISSNCVCLFLFFQICLCICHSPCDCLHGPVPNHCFLLLLFFLFLFENIKVPNKTRGGGVLHQLLRARLHVRHPRENVHKLLVTEFKLSPLNPNCPSLDLSVFKDRRRYICRSRHPPPPPPSMYLEFGLG